MCKRKTYKENLSSLSKRSSFQKKESGKEEFIHAAMEWYEKKKRQEREK